MTLVADRVGFAYGADAVLNEVSVAVEPGEVLAIIGPSGAGKTTLLRLLALFDRPTDGRIALDGDDVWSLDDRARLSCRRRLGMVFQEARLFDGSVKRNVEYGLKVRRGWTWRMGREVRSHLGVAAESSGVRESLELVGLAGEFDRAADTLSGGQAQRVAFARALVYEPEFLLLDEPTSELDPRNTAVIEESVRAAASRGIGVAIATHDMHQAERVADRVAVILGGQVIEVGDVAQVFSEPADDRTSRFIDGELVYA